MTLFMFIVGDDFEDRARERLVYAGMIFDLILVAIAVFS